MTDEKYFEVLQSLGLTGEWADVDFIFAPHPQSPHENNLGKIEVTNHRPGVDLTTITTYKINNGADRISKFVVISDLSAVGLTDADLDDFELEMLGKSKSTTA